MADIDVEVVYATPVVQVLRKVVVEEGATLVDAIIASNLLEDFPEIDLEVNRTGIFGVVASLDHPLEAGDRVEIYRKLVMDPKEARRQRARKNT